MTATKTVSKSKAKPKSKPKKVEEEEVEDENPDFDHYELDENDTAVMDLMYDDLGKYETQKLQLSLQLTKITEQINLFNERSAQNQATQLQTNGSISAMQRTITQFTASLNARYPSADENYQWNVQKSRFEKKKAN